MPDSLCDGMASSFNSQYNKFKSKKDKLSNSVNDVMSKADNVDLSESTGEDIVKDSISSATSEVTNRMEEAKDKSTSLAGSCLDGVYNNIKDTMSNVNDLVGDMMPSNIPETDLLGGLSSLSNLMEKAGIQDLIKKMDELLGCLSDSECIPIDEIDNSMNDINTFVDDAGLTDEGVFDQDTFLEKKGASQKVKDIGNNYKDDITNSKNQVYESAKSTKESIESVKFGNAKVPSSYI